MMRQETQLKLDQLRLPLSNVSSSNVVVEHDIQWVRGHH
jgi:hypothetical protein